VGGIDVFSAGRVTDVLTAARQVQIPLLAVLLLGACAAKALRAVSGRSIADGIGPTALFPVRLHRPMAIALPAGEFALGAGLVLTAGQIGAGTPALAIRLATALLFGTAVGALHVLQGRKPDAGCGCFGDLSETPVSWRALARSALLCAAAVATIGVPPLQLPNSGRHAVLVLSVAAAELLVLAFLSPEIGEIMVRLGYSEPCEVRRLPVSRTLAALHASSHWRRYRRILVSPEEPVDVWREGCWRYVVFQGLVASRHVDVVFAVYLKPRRAPVRAGIFDATADKRAKAAADAAAAFEADAIPAPRPAPAPSPTLIAAPARTPHGVPHRAPHRAVHHVPHQRRRHSADL
jgi:hypothetical protein